MLAPAPGCLGVGSTGIPSKALSYSRAMDAENNTGTGGGGGVGVLRLLCDLGRALHFSEPICSFIKEDDIPAL